MRRTFSRVVAQDLAPCLPKIKAETLLIWGENDDATPLWMGQRMEKDIRGAALIVMQNGGISHIWKGIRNSRHRI